LERCRKTMSRWFWGVRFCVPARRLVPTTARPTVRVPGPSSRAEFISKLGDCLKELEESAYWLELLVDSGCGSAGKMAALPQETNELIAIFTTISKKTKARTVETA